MKKTKKNTMEMKSWSRKRGYSKSLVEKEFGKVTFSNKVGNKQPKEKVIPFVVTYHPNWKNIGNIIRQNIFVYE